MDFSYIIMAAFWTVLVAELIGDKSIYTVASLSLRFRTGLMLLGMAVAFGGKMLIAVLLGQALVHISPRWTAAVSALLFFSAALFSWLRRPDSAPAQTSPTATWSRATFVPFALLLLTEWGDPGQMSAAALTAQSHLPLAVWLGGTSALMTKGAFAMTLGVKLRRRVSEKVLRTLAVVSCCILGALALCEAIFH